MKPIIGITADHHVAEVHKEWLYQTTAYFRAVQKAGGLPVLLPFLDSEEDADRLLRRVDGLLMSGGGDMDPKYFGEHPHPQLGNIQPDRDRTELLLAQAALAADMPILGICRGHQVLAVAGGGTLIQDIAAQVPGAIKHRQGSNFWYPTHTVAVQSGSRLEALLGGPEIAVNSSHHQAVKRLPDGWIGTATAPDGVNEAYEIPGKRFVVSVQWHPERMYDGKLELHGALFTALVEAAASR